MTTQRAALALALLGAIAACGAISGRLPLSDAQQVVADMRLGPAHPAAGDLRIVGEVDRADRRYRLGEPIALSVRVNEQAFIAVLRVLPTGATTLIFPNRGRPSARTQADTPLHIVMPGARPGAAGERPGVVLFEFVAARNGGSWLFDRKPAGSADFADLGATTRALAKDIVTSLHGGRGGDAAAVALAVRVAGD